MGSYDWSSQDTSRRSRSRDAVVQKVRDRFAQFGREVIAAVTDCAVNPKRMEGLFERLDLHPREDLDSQLDALFYYVAQSGEARFVTRARVESWRGAQGRPNDEPDDGQQIRYNSAVEKLASSLNRRVETVDLSPILADAEPPAKQAASAPSPAAQAPAEAPPEAELLAHVEPLPWIETAGYVGPERRSGPQDRRRSDRRGSLEAIRRNNRFGRDRRVAPRGRRSTDRATSGVPGAKG